MKRLIKIGIAAATVSLISVYAMANQASGQFYAAAIDGCQIVKQIELDKEATAAWHQIKDIEQRMGDIHQPLRQVERTLAEYGEELEQLTQTAIQEDVHSLYIDKALLREQTQMAEKMSDLVDAHQAEFDALEDYGNELSELADKFSAPIEKAFDGLEFDRVEIFEKGENPLDRYCSDSKKM